MALVVELPIRRNTALLSAGMALNSATFQLVAAVSSITFVLVTGITGLVGLGPAIFMVSSAVGSLLGGRAMDRIGRVRGIAWVLFGSVFGAILGPAVFSPIFAGRQLDAEALVGPWLVSSLIALLGIGVVLCIRPDPKRIAELIAPPRPEGVLAP